MPNKINIHYLNNIVTESMMYNTSGHWSNEFTIKTLSESIDKFNATFYPFNPHEYTTKELFDLGFGNWDGSLLLIPIYLWNLIPDGTQLYCIDNTWVTKEKPQKNDQIPEWAIQHME